MNKILATCLGICLILGLSSFNVLALKESVPESGPKVLETRISPTMMAAPSRDLPDLTVVSAEMGIPYFTLSNGYLKVPLTINFTNLGSDTYEE